VSGIHQVTGLIPVGFTNFDNKFATFPSSGSPGKMGRPSIPLTTDATAGMLTGMRVNTKSSITLPPEELRMVLALQAKLKAKSKVEVVRRGLRLLREVTERDALREAYRQASRATRASLSHEIDELDHLVAEGLSES
jgi:Arc/MetJ-type ribon-helix-helix transcriptional regulator